MPLIFLLMGYWAAAAFPPSEMIHRGRVLPKFF